MPYEPDSQQIQRMDVKVRTEYSSVSSHYQVERKNEWWGMGDEVLVIRDNLSEVSFNIKTGTISYESLRYVG